MEYGRGRTPVNGQGYIIIYPNLKWRKGQHPARFSPFVGVKNKPGWFGGHSLPYGNQAVLGDLLIVHGNIGEIDLNIDDK